MEPSTRPAAEVFSRLAAVWTSGDAEVARRAAATFRDGGAILDVGCGTGELLPGLRDAIIARGLAVSRLVGVDLAPGMVTAAARLSGVRAVAGDAVALPFADQVFELVVASKVLHFVGDPGRAARELVRVTVPGGTVVVELAPRPPGLRALPFDVGSLPADSLLRRYLELPRSYGVARFLRTLEAARCGVDEVILTAPAAPDGRGSFLSRVAALSGTPADLRAADAIQQAGGAGGDLARRLIVVRVPGPRRGKMPIRVRDLEGMTPDRVARAIEGLPAARGYELVVKPLKYRTRPHVQAFCEFGERRITIQVPVPFRPFSEDVPYRAQRVGAKGMRFRWFVKRVRFERPDELIRYLYLHEYYHWYLRECLGKRSGAETACDRFALQRM